MRKVKQVTVEHKTTGAIVPVVITKKNPIQYTECLKDRKAFTIDMLSIRWKRDVKDCAAMLQKFQVPAYLHRARMESENVNLSEALHAALFFEEYIYAIENKMKLSKNKLKSQPLETFLQG